MRDIKFRFYHLNKKIMSAVEDIQFFENNEFAANSGQMDGILLQFIGLLDKNGKEIYEGDIVKISPDPRAISKEDFIEDITFGENGCCYAIMGFSLYCHHADRCEIIGNIYENPELLS